MSTFVDAFKFDVSCLTGLCVLSGSRDSELLTRNGLAGTFPLISVRLSDDTRNPEFLQ